MKSSREGPSERDFAKLLVLEEEGVASERICRDPTLDMILEGPARSKEVTRAVDIFVDDGERGRPD